MARLLEQVSNQVFHTQDAVRAAPDDRTPEWQGHRNGSYLRDLTTRVVMVTLRVPRLPDGSFSPELFARYQRTEQGLVLALLEMVVTGVSTPKVTRITEELCGTELSKSAVPALDQQLDPVVAGWRTRSLAETVYPVLLVGALVLRIREGGHGRQRARCGVLRVNRDGMPEILGFGVGDSESEASWRMVCQDLKAPGLQGEPRGLGSACRRGERPAAGGPRDHLAAVSNAFRPEYPGCLLEGGPRSLPRRTPDRLRRSGPEAGGPAPATPLEDLARTARRLWLSWRPAIEDSLALVAYPPGVRPRLRTTHDVERLNREIRRRERIIRILPHRTSAARLLGAVLMAQHEARRTGRRYGNLDTEWVAREPARAQKPPAIA